MVVLTYVTKRTKLLRAPVLYSMYAIGEGSTTRTSKRQMGGGAEAD